ncbi:MAG: hypothetical protein IJF78_01495 [Clostridia bacterium]|nr:hypothetical protein [Clostridia bacterium]
MKRLSCICLAMIMMLSSCSQATVNESDESSRESTSEEQAANADTERSESETEEELKPGLPEGYSFDGKTFTIMCNDYPLEPGWSQLDIYAEEIRGTSVNDAVFNRNAKVESDYDCKIDEYRLQIFDFQSQLPVLVKANDDSVDAATPYFWAGQLADMTLDGNFVELSGLSSMTLSNPWYDQQAVDAFTIFDKLYFVVSDMTIGDLIATSGMVFNKQIYENYQYNSTYGNLYDLVREDKWTHDLFSKMVLSLSEDVNGDGKMTNEDFYGLLYQRDSIPSFVNSYNMRMAEANEDGVPVYSLVTESNANKLDAMFDFLYQQNSCFNVMNWFDGTETNFTTGMTNMFSENQAMFMWIRFADVEHLRTMDLDFGIVPVPKWDEAQEQYHSTVNQYMGVATVIPVSCADPEMTGYFLEAISCESKKQLIPAYYDVVLQGKITRDEESKEMLDIIFNNRLYDIGLIFDIGGFGEQFYNLGAVYDAGYTNLWARGKNVYQRMMDRFAEDWQEIGE